MSVRQVQMELPSMRTRPSYEVLGTCLDAMNPNSTIYNGVIFPRVSISDSVVQDFCMSVISCGLDWLSPEQQETILDKASKRVAERCGRSAMPSMTRTWAILNPNNSEAPETNLHLREPALTGDTLGHKTWATSYVLAKKLASIAEDHLPLPSTLELPTKILERSGTGLVGLAAAHLFPSTHVTLTDLPLVIDNLSHNVEHNKPVSSTVSTEVLDWSDPQPRASTLDSKFDIIIAADPLYDSHHPEILAQTIDLFLEKESGKGRVLIAVPMRDEATRRFNGVLGGLMEGKGFVRVAKGEEECRDEDWEVRIDQVDDGEGGVKMVWCVWKWVGRKGTGLDG